MDIGGHHAGRAVGRPIERAYVRRDLLDATLRLLEAVGAPPAGVTTARAVTVAAIVGEAGCTPPTLYHYWANREELLREASEIGWEQFRSAQDSGAGGASDPLERIRRRGTAYLEFAFARPGLFRVIFLDKPVPSGPAAGPSAEPSAGPALLELVADVGEAMAAGLIRTGDPLPVALLFWAAVHGVATLWCATPGLPRALAENVLATQHAALIAGLSDQHPPRP
jgi:AcrR family transcriptional regulator